MILVALQEGIRGHNLSGDAEPALDSALFYKGFLQRVQFHFLVDALRKSLDGDDGLAIGTLGGINAGHGRLAVHQDGTCAALGLLASDLRAGKMKSHTEKGSQSLARQGFQGLVDAVNCKIDFAGHSYLPI
jgi:hypothetical protein